MIRNVKSALVLFSFLTSTLLAGTVNAPFFADPNYHGSCDPEIVWNPEKEEWFIYYTARRAKRESATYVGTPIGVISSKDLVHWNFHGYCSFDGVEGEPDMPVTYWAPGIIREGDTLHMFVTYKDNANPPWGGKGVIRHYKAPVSDPVNGWKLVGVPDFAQPDPIDATLIKVDGEYRAYHRVANGGGIQWARSNDLVNWKNQGKCPGDVNEKSRGYGYQEAPYVFRFKGYWWMLTDPHKGLAVFRSEDAITWRFQERILEDPGARPQDNTLARHPSVAVVGDRAFLLYHVEPNRPYPTPPAEQRTVEQKLSFLQLAELDVVDGQLVCDRDAEVELDTKLPPRWSREKATTWYDGIDWPVGANFVPSNAINQLEMWQADTFDPEAIDRELGWTAGIGMNTMRTFLHDLAWKQDPEGFLNRVDTYLEIADKHGIRTMFVFFDGVWNPDPKAGKQPDPRPGVHNSGWVQSPGRDILDDLELQDSLKAYVQAVVSRYKDDDRVLIWDLFNEPENANRGKYGGGTTKPELPQPLKKQRTYELLVKTFQWVREVNPSQPLTAGVWGGPTWLEEPDYIERLSLDQSDIISFHSYAGPERTLEMVEGLQEHGRPILCTEYMARSAGSTFEGILPIFHEHRIGAYNWGLVNGKSQTIYPWDSWKKPYTDEPNPWFHDVFRKDGLPYDKTEAELIRSLTGSLPQFTFQGVALHPDELSYVPTGDIVHPSIVKMEGRVADPLGKYYMYYSPHKHRGISMAYSDSMEGPWTEYGSNPVIEDAAAPDIRWIDESGKFHMWGHRKNSQTECWTSDDGLKFEYAGVSVTSKNIGTRNASYSRVYKYPLKRFGSSYVMLYSGFLNEKGIRGVWLAYSRDAINWTQLKEPLVEPIDGEMNDLYGPALLQYSGKVFVVYQDHTSWRGGNVKYVELDPELNPIGDSGKRHVLLDPDPGEPLKDRYRGGEFYRENGILYLYSSASRSPRILVYATAPAE
ncbi:MAG: cellulase family glycosylhydrolase [Puniceicoccaceae bacterium]